MPREIVNNRKRDKHVVLERGIVLNSQLSESDFKMFYEISKEALIFVNSDQ